MDTKELELVEKLAPQHADVKTLWDEHVLYEKKLEKLESKPFRSPVEDQEMRLLKKQKLDGKTKLVELLQTYNK